jgi:hypothetical protein
MTDYERGYEQGKADATKKMHPEIRKCLEDYFDKCFKEYDKHLRPWVGLTDEEIETFVAHLYPLPEKPVKERLRAIETKLRERNT